MDYRIVCTEQSPFGNPPDHAHIVAVGTGHESSSASYRWTLDEVLVAMGNGHRFFTHGDRSGQTALVTAFWCPSCLRNHIRSMPDAVSDNNLDSLPYCRWSS